MKKVRNFIFLPYWKKRLLCQSLFLLCAIRLGLWILPFRKLNKWLPHKNSGGVGEKNPDWRVIKNVVQSVGKCSGYVPGATCLTQALAARTLLRLEGQSSQLKIGVEKDKDNKLAAHAWIEIDGYIVIGKVPQHQRYTVLNATASVII